ncbi:MAG: portal protein [Phycisphaerales bacterium]
MLADLTVPRLNPKGIRGSSGNGGMVSNKFVGYQSLPRPLNNAGTRCVTGLASTLVSLLVPTSTDWFDLDIPLEIKATLDPTTYEASKTLTAVLKQRIFDLQMEHGLPAQLAAAMPRLLVEGQFVIQVTNERLRFIPLRSFGVSRYNGKVCKIIIQELADDQNKDSNDEVYLYTLVDYEKDKVYQQKTGQKDARVVDFSPKQYVLPTTSVPQIENYACGYAWDYYGTIFEINKKTESLSKIVTMAGISALFIDPNALFTPREFMDALQQGKNIISGFAKDISPFTMQEKLADAAAITADIQRLEADLARAFLLGIYLYEQGVQPKTATEIMKRTQEVDAATQALASTLMNTLQKPLVEAYMHVLDINIQIQGKPAIRPVIIAGSSKLSKLVQANGLLSAMQAAAAINPQFVQQIDGTKVFKMIAQANGVLDADSYLLPPQAQMPQQGQVPPAPPAQ